MKKIVVGLLGIVLSCIGCQEISITNKDAMKIEGYSNEIRKLVGKDLEGRDIIGTNDNYAIYPPEKKGDSLYIFARDKKAIKLIKFYDSDFNGSLDSREVTTISLELDILGIIPPDPNFKIYKPKFDPNTYRFRPYIPEEKNNKKEKKLWVYKN